MVSKKVAKPTATKTTKTVASENTKPRGPSARKTAKAAGSSAATVESKPMDEHTPSAADTQHEQRLTVLFTDRLTQALDRRSDVIRAGRGRVGDFARYFDIHYTTAQRLLAGESLPPVALLAKITAALQVPSTWLLGEDDNYDIDQTLEKSIVKVWRYSPADASHLQVHIDVPIPELPQGFDSSRLVYARAVGKNSVTHTIIAKVLLEPVNDVIHLVYYPKSNYVCLRRVQVMPSLGKVYIHPGDGGDSEVFKMDKLAFGEVSADTGGKVCIVGPVVASLHFGIDFS